MKSTTESTTPRFSIDRHNRIPIYLQLIDQIRYFISTGSLRAEEKLPPVKGLAKDLGINFLTVRKAYKELERSGLINVRHGEGSFISLNLPSPTESNLAPTVKSEFSSECKALLQRFETRGMSIAEMRSDIETAIDDLLLGRNRPIVVFAECNDFQVREISRIIENEIQIPVTSVLVSDLRSAIPPLTERGRVVDLITTGFHVSEVRRIIGELPVRIEVLITNLNPATRRKLESYGEDANFSFVCRDRESAVLYRDLLKAELGFQSINLVACTISETAKVREIVESDSVVLVSPPVFEEVSRMVQNGKEIYNVFERVDPFSLQVIKERILDGWQTRMTA